MILNIDKVVQRGVYNGKRRADRVKRNQEEINKAAVDILKSRFPENSKDFDQFARLFKEVESLIKEMRNIGMKVTSPKSARDYHVFEISRHLNKSLERKFWNQFDGAVLALRWEILVPNSKSHMLLLPVDRDNKGYPIYILDRTVYELLGGMVKALGRLFENFQFATEMGYR